MDYELTNPVPQKGDKIRITSINNNRTGGWKVGDIVEVIDGKPDFCGKPGFCAIFKYKTWDGRILQRKSWNGPNSYNWEIIERDGKPYHSPARLALDRSRAFNPETREKYIKFALSNILKNESLTRVMTTIKGDGVAVKETAKDFVTLAAAIADEMIREVNGLPEEEEESESDNDESELSDN